MQLQHGISGSAGLCAGTLGIGKPAVLQGVCPRPASPSPTRLSEPRNDLQYRFILFRHRTSFINTFISMSAIGSHHSVHILPSERNAEER